jgi:hypothetical protein
MYAQRLGLPCAAQRAEPAGPWPNFIDLKAHRQNPMFGGSFTSRRESFWSIMMKGQICVHLSIARFNDSGRHSVSIDDVECPDDSYYFHNPEEAIVCGRVFSCEAH